MFSRKSKKLNDERYYICSRAFEVLSRFLVQISLTKLKSRYYRVFENLQKSLTHSLTHSFRLKKLLHSQNSIIEKFLKKVLSDELNFFKIFRFLIHHKFV